MQIWASAGALVLDTRGSNAGDGTRPILSGQITVH
jgi:hypothetical protein